LLIQACESIKVLFAWVERQFKREIKVSFSDGEKTLGTAYFDWFKKKGIERDQSARYTPSQNGRAERVGGF
jgi:transposase InsO family protein